MPIPTRSVGDILKFLKKDNPNMPHRQKLAIALSTTRKEGSQNLTKEVERRRK